MSLGLYKPGNSVVHRIAPAWKLISLAVFGTLLFLTSNLLVIAVSFAATLLLFPVAGFDARTIYTQIRPALFIFVIIFVAQIILNDWLLGFVVILRLATLILFASLVTLTTRASDMIEAMERGLWWTRYFGVKPAKISLALSLSLRFIPVIASITNDVREAQKARGLDRSIIAIAVPVLIRTIKMGSDISDAMDARSYDPD